MKTHKHIWAAIDVLAALVLGAILIETARAQEYFTFTLSVNLRLPATKVRNDFRHLHVSETNEAAVC
jgi:hypothetical protein